MVTCSVCRDNFYHLCVELSIAELRSIKAKKNIRWACMECSSLGNDIDELKALIISLKKEIEVLRVNVVKVSENSNSGFDFEEAIQEFNERSKRKSNLVLFGIPEPDNTVVNHERQNHDKNEVQRVIQFISPDLNISNTSLTRLGKYDPTKAYPRPIKISLDSEQLVHKVIKNANKLRNSQYNNIKLSFDRTPRQIEYYRSVKSQLTERQSQGESNLKIKYIKGIPSIVSLN